MKPKHFRVPLKSSPRAKKKSTPSLPSNFQPTRIESSTRIGISRMNFRPNFASLLPPTSLATRSLFSLSLAAQARNNTRTFGDFTRAEREVSAIRFAARGVVSRCVTHRSSFPRPRVREGGLCFLGICKGRMRERSIYFHRYRGDGIMSGCALV